MKKIAAVIILASLSAWWLASFLFGIVLLMKQSLYPVLKYLAIEPEAGLAAWGSAVLWALG